MPIDHFSLTSSCLQFVCECSLCVTLQVLCVPPGEERVHTHVCAGPPLRAHH